MNVSVVVADADRYPLESNLGSVTAPSFDSRAHRKAAEAGSEPRPHSFVSGVSLNQDNVVPKYTFTRYNIRPTNYASVPVKIRRKRRASSQAGDRRHNSTEQNDSESVDRSTYGRAQPVGRNVWDKAISFPSLINEIKECQLVTRRACCESG